MSEYKFDKQNNVSFPQTFSVSQPVPLVANRIFGTLLDAQNFIKNNVTAIAGLLLRVIEDGDPENNGVYFVAKVNDGLELQKVCIGKAANDGKLTVKLGDQNLIEFSANQKNDVDIQLWGEDNK